MHRLSRVRYVGLSRPQCAARQLEASPEQLHAEEGRGIGLGGTLREFRLYVDASLERGSSTSSCETFADGALASAGARGPCAHAGGTRASQSTTRAGGGADDDPAVPAAAAAAVANARDFM